MKSVIDQLQLLASLQCDKDLYFTDGLYPVERVWAKGLYQRKDNTAFFAACIGFTLLRYQKHFSKEEQVLANGILEKMKSAFEYYRNKDGHASYNFWQTKPSKHFPGGIFARRFKFFMIPDDIDDSAMIHLVKAHTKEEQLDFKTKMARYAIGNLKWPDRPVIGYENYKSYNTFFVKNMPAAFDVCALCNVLYFVYETQLQLNEQDEHSLKVIVHCIDNDDYIHRPYAVSPYYPNTVLIIYHVVRFMMDLKVQALLVFKMKLIKQCEQMLSNEKRHGIEKLLLNICLIKMNASPLLMSEPSEIEKSQFPFFVAGILGEVSPKWLRKMAVSKETHILYRSKAYAEALWLEHLLLNRIQKK
jgi:hypothetical protein